VTSTDRVLVTNVRALRVLSHPLRMRLLGLLRLEGPSTATRLGGRLGESSGTTSYHLRQLADHGFVADSDGLGTGRERWWHAVHRTTEWHTEDFGGDEGQEVLDELERRLVAQRGRLLTAYLEQRDSLGPAWNGASSLNDWALRLTPEQARELSAEIGAVVARWADRHPAAQPADGSRLVSLTVDLSGSASGRSDRDDAMTAPATVRSATRRYVVLLALHWFPVGLTLPVMVLLMQSRGLSLAEVGLLFGVYGALGVCLELPTGGLADVVGRRPVLLAAVALHALACGVFVVADGFGAFLAAFAAKGVGRALYSGPLQAWYVDAVHALDPGADLAPGLSRGAAADAGSLAVAAAVGGALPALLGGSLAAPFAVAAGPGPAVRGRRPPAGREVRPPREGSLRAALADGARALPRTVAGAVRLSVTDPPLRLVLLLAGGRRAPA
jgi:DNA-binding transcriptional ArsR family regulator